MSLRIIGIDLAVRAQHVAAIWDPANQQFLCQRYRFPGTPAGIDKLLDKARADAPPDLTLVAVLEATGMSWFEVGQYLHRHGVEVYRVNGRLTKTLRQLGWRDARSDKLDSLTLAKLFLATPKPLNRWKPPTGGQLALQRSCRELNRLTQLISAIQLRLKDYDRWTWGGLTDLIPDFALYWVRQHWYDPWKVLAAGESQLRLECEAEFPLKTDTFDTWIPQWLARAEQRTHYFASSDAVGFAYLQETNQREIRRLETCQKEKKTLLTDTIIPLYRSIYPDCPLPTIPGVGLASAAVYRGFIMDISRFPSANAFMQWTGMVPKSNQSGDARSQRTHITRHGPNLIKTTLYQNANVARQRDVQLAKIYYTQMVDYGKVHHQAVCAVASHLARRIYALLRDNRSFEFRDTNDRPISKSKARQLVLKHYVVPESVRKQRRKRQPLTADPSAK